MPFRSLIPFGRSTSLRGGETDSFTSLRREMDRLFDDFGRGFAMPAAFADQGFLSPKVDVAETESGLEITAELPGIDQKDISLDLADGVLTLKAEHKVEKEEKDEAKRYHLVERSYGTFLRRFALPFEADQEKVEAGFDKGVLKIVVPKSQNAKPKAKKIEVKAN